MPCASATASVDGPYVEGELQPTDTVPLDSRFTVLVKPDETVEAAHVNITFPLGLKVEFLTLDPAALFDLPMYQNGTDGGRNSYRRTDPPYSACLSGNMLHGNSEGNLHNISFVSNKWSSR